MAASGQDVTAIAAEYGEDIMPRDTGIGAATVRREDVSFLTGTGEYTDDIVLAKQTYAVFAR